jgi:hypothetical protein
MRSWQGCGCALSIQRLEGNRLRVRQTRALCKFKWAKEWDGGVARVCRRAGQMTLCTAKWCAATEPRKEVSLKGPQERICFGARQSDT